MAINANFVQDSETTSDRYSLKCSACNWPLYKSIAADQLSLVRPLDLYFICDDCRDKYLNFLRAIQKLK